MRVFKLEFYVPADFVDAVKEAVLNTGAGRIDNYDFCCWQTKTGTGQFRALDGSNPYIGKIHEIEKVEEIKVELVCSEEFLDNAVRALIDAHPYEVPAYQFWEINKK